MSEEQAIEHLKSYRYTCNPITSQHIDIVLNLIEKQQKEIEELQKKINMKKVMVKNMPKDVELILMYKNDFDRNFGSDYVSKDKIKQKIKEWDINIKWANADDHYYAIKILKALLEE